MTYTGWSARDRGLDRLLAALELFAHLQHVPAAGELPGGLFAQQDDLRPAGRGLLHLRQVLVHGAQDPEIGLRGVPAIGLALEQPVDDLVGQDVAVLHLQDGLQQQRRGVTRRVEREIAVVAEFADVEIGEIGLDLQAVVELVQHGGQKFLPGPLVVQGAVEEDPGRQRQGIPFRGQLFQFFPVGPLAQAQHELVEAFAGLVQAGPLQVCRQLLPTSPGSTW